MNERKAFLSIGKAASYLGVSIMTLRRWHKAGSFPATFVSPGKHLYYSLADLQRKTKGLTQAALDWASADIPKTLPSEWHCPTSDVFRARLERFTRDLLDREPTRDLAPLIASSAGEIGNNSYDHNLGNWPDVNGILFAYDPTKRIVVLADRGIGILATLRRIRPTLQTHTEALKVAFTEIITGRAPEHRGNGLKYVRRAINESQASLRFWTGDAFLNLTNDNAILEIVESDIFIRGCVAMIDF